MFMQCRVTNRTILALRSTTKEERIMEALEVEEEVEDLVEATDKLFATTTNKRDITHEIAPTPPQNVSISSPMTMLLKNFLFYKLSGKKRDHGWETKMFS